jgi:FKBP-type peptidyl-prolyl cis-trans isomerase SlyD
MSESIEDGKFVELSYTVIDQKSGEPLVAVEYPIGYVHGQSSVLDQSVTSELEGKKEGDFIEVPIDCNTLYGPRDETLVFTDRLENVPEEYREVGTTITMENDKGEPRNFIVTRIDDKTLTVDGNNPLSGRHVIFKLSVLNVREATDEEIEVGGAIVPEPDVGGTVKVPI